MDVMGRKRPAAQIVAMVVVACAVGAVSYGIAADSPTPASVQTPSQPMASSPAPVTSSATRPQGFVPGPQATQLQPAASPGVGAVPVVRPAGSPALQPQQMGSVQPTATGDGVSLAAFQDARKLEQAGKLQEAFLTFAAIPGAEQMAVRIGQAKPAEYFALLKAYADRIPEPLAKIIEGDLRLAQGDKQAALACYRDVAKMAATDEGQGWTANHVPHDSYVVEPAIAPGDVRYENQPAQPFTIGPGSHRDNWLIRRFIAMDAWDDASAEFARVWDIHRRYARPYRVLNRLVMASNKTTVAEQLVRPAGFNSLGLQFALDYAFFLNRLKQHDQALGVVEEPLLAIDMDRNPNCTTSEAVTSESARYPRMQGYVRSSHRGNLGVSRKEFVRLAYGIFKDAGKERNLIDDIEKKVAGGENRLRRVLACVRFHQGKTDEALDLELEYIKQGGFDPLTATYRHGLVYEESNRPADAVAAYKQALTMPFKPLRLPDSEETISQGPMSQMAFQPMPVPDGETSFRIGVLNRLERLYGALGKPDKAFELVLREMETDPMLIACIELLEQAALRAEALGRQTVFLDWARRQALAAKDPATRANLHWCSKDYAACAHDLAEQWKSMDRQSVGYTVQMWLDRFRKVGKTEFRLLLTAALDADPSNARARLELLDLNERIEGPEVISAFESLLETDATFAFARGKGGFNPTRFRNYFDLAYRLMRLYEKEKQPAKLLALGLRIAAGEKPFDKWWRQDLTQHEYRDANDWPEDVNACLALLVQEADAATLAKLDQLWKDIPDCPAKRQLARWRGGGPAIRPELKDIGWQHLPAGVRLLAASANVLSLGRDEKYVYVGHPWGVEVYDLKGEPVTRIPLGEPAEALAAADGIIWAGTPRGLYKIDSNGWAVSHLWLHGDVEPRNRSNTASPESGNYWFDNMVYTLVPDGEDLWIGMHRNIQRLNTRTMMLRAFSFRELHSEYWIGVNEIVPDGPYIWAGGRDTLLRYDRASDTWDRVQFGKKDFGLLGVVDGKVFGNTWLDDKLRHRPCVVDRQTLKVKPLLIDPSCTDADRLVNFPFSYYGHRQGRIVLMAEGSCAYLVSEATDSIRPLSVDGGPLAIPLETVLPKNFQARLLGWDRINSGKDILVRNLKPSPCSLLARGDRPLVVGRGEELNADRQLAFCHENRGESGLWFHSADKRATLVSQSPHGDRLAADTVYGIVEDPNAERKWLVTAYGLAMLDANDRVLATLTRDDGLVANRITDGVALDGRLYFSAAWGDHGGGLAILDPETTVLTARFIADGLATDKIAAIEKAGDRLKLVYGIEYGRGGDYRCRQFSPGMFDPRTGIVESGGPPRFFGDSGLPAGAAPPLFQGSSSAPGPVPFLGGRLLSKQTIDEKTYLCGERGLVILTSAVPPESTTVELTVKLIVDSDLRLQAEAKAAQLVVNSPEDLEAALKTSNPLLRARAIATVLGMSQDKRRQFIATIGPCVHDSHIRVRSTTVAMLSMIDDDAVRTPMKEATHDRDPYIRAVASLTLARRGQLPSLDEIKELLDGQFRNFPFGADSSVGVLVDRGRVEAALAPHANAEIFKLLLENPPRAEIYDAPPGQSPFPNATDNAKNGPLLELGNASLFREPGKSLRQHPEAAKILLTAYDDEPHNMIRRDFARNVFRFAGPAMLPLLYGELKSEDRVVRSNAARACGAIGQRGAIPHLLAALDTESGLARASIVWALGELKAREALPQMAAFYVDARNDEKRRHASGFLMAQAAAQFESHVENLRNLRDIEAEWDELKQQSRRQPIDPRRNEDLLEVRTILDAVAKIGPESSQEFYRKLAGESDQDVRQEAARRLGEVPSEINQNMPVLRNLLADKQETVRMAAAVSLLMLGETDVCKPIMSWLQSPEKWQHVAIIRELVRVKDGRLLIFSAEFVKQLLKRIPK